MLDREIRFLSVLTLLILLSFSLCLSEVSVNGYANIVIPEHSSDRYGVGAKLRRMAAEHGLRVFLSGDEVPEEELLQTCSLFWQIQIRGYHGTIQVKVYDTTSQTMIFETDGSGTAWRSAKGAVKRAVRKIWKNIDYTGYNKVTHRRNLTSLYPKRPTVAFDESAFTATVPTDPIVGIWTDPANTYRIAITSAEISANFNYTGIVLHSNHQLWNTGEVKLELNQTAIPNVYVGNNFYVGNKKRQGVTMALEKEVFLTFDLTTPEEERREFSLVKVWPPMKASMGPNPSWGTDHSESSGSGFLVSTDGLIATNWHVVDNASEISVHFPESSRPFKARVIIKDPSNDLALLKLEAYSASLTGCTKLPYRLSSTSRVSLGDEVSTLGYPVENILGTSPKYTVGVISSKAGLDDDPTHMQISTEVHPGNSGGPLFDEENNVVGVVVSKVSAQNFYAATGDIPQNINYAVKADYLLNLMNMLPETPSTEYIEEQSPQEISKCIGLLRVQHPSH